MDGNQASAAFGVLLPKLAKTHNGLYQDFNIAGERSDYEAISHLIERISQINYIGGKHLIKTMSGRSLRHWSKWAGRERLEMFWIA